MKPQFNSGLLPLKYDNRDKKFTQTAFGAAQPLPLPKTLGRVRRIVKNQYDSQSCTAHTVTSCSEYQEKIALSPEWQWAQTCKKLGTFIPPGSDPRTAMKIAVDMGSLPAELSPLTFAFGNYQEVGNWRNYPRTLEDKAEPQKKAAYVRPPSFGDAFDSIRQALLRGEQKNQTVMMFGGWYDIWMGETIPVFETPLLGLHAYLAVDFDTINGIDCLVIQNSYGEDAGIGGFQYMPREACNRSMGVRGAGYFVYEDLTPEQIANAKKDTPAGYLQRSIIQLWHLIADIYGSLA